MKQSLKERIYWTTAITALVASLLVLAVLQFRWSRELNEAAEARLRANLQSSMIGMRLDLAREFSTITQALQLDPKPSPEDQAEEYAQRLLNWKRSAVHPDLVSGLYIAQEFAPDKLQFRQLDPVTNRFVAGEAPAAFQNLTATLLSSDDHDSNEPPPLHESERNPRPDHNRHERSGPPSRWSINLNAPALFRDIDFEPKSHSGQRRSWLIIELNSAVIKNQLIPELAERYFGNTDGLTYDVAVVHHGATEQTLFSSSAQAASSTGAATDGRMFLFGFPFGPPGQQQGRVELRLPPDKLLSREQRAFIPRLEPLRRADRNENWEILVRHRKGSLEAALASIRRQHLAISFGMLLLLSATVTMVILATRRAHNLARQQMEFVAGVSHELRTPLAVIASAADNIADGIVTDPSKLVRYGTVIRKHTRQLTQLVEQILLFSAARNQSYHYSLSCVQPSEIVKSALDRSAELLSEQGFSVTEEIAPGLPGVLVDQVAICHCLENLITNAVKYSGDNRWIRVSAGISRDDMSEILITVEDRGIGIAREELRKVFDAFYRSPEVVSAQIRGTGLGLSLARSIAESMGGRLTVTSERGKGSKFVLHLPVATEPATQPLSQTARAADRSTES
jgi:signal transduction histidine kinase